MLKVNLSFRYRSSQTCAWLFSSMLLYRVCSVKFLFALFSQSRQPIKKAFHIISSGFSQQWNGFVWKCQSICENLSAARNFEQIRSQNASIRLGERNSVGSCNKNSCSPFQPYNNSKPPTQNSFHKKGAIFRFCLSTFCSSRYIVHKATISYSIFKFYCSHCFNIKILFIITCPPSSKKNICFYKYVTYFKYGLMYTFIYF